MTACEIVDAGIPERYRMLRVAESMLNRSFAAYLYAKAGAKNAKTHSCNYNADGSLLAGFLAAA